MRKEFTMKTHLLKKAATLAVSGIMSLSLLGNSLPLKEKAAAADRSRVSVHDPSVVKAENGTYYVFGSHIDAAKTSDLKNWKLFTNGYARTNNVEFGNLSANLKKAFDWAGEDLGDCVGGFAVWAPDVVWNPDYINADGSKGSYLMYFCTSSTWNTSVIAYAASKNIEGPFTFVDTLVYSGFTSNDTYAKSTTKNVNRKYTSTNIDELITAGEITFNQDWFSGTGYNYRAFPNAIDPTIYTDTEGRMYMVYGSWSGGIFTLEVDKSTGKCIRPKSGKTADGRTIDSYFGTKLSGGYHKSGEGPFIEYNPDTGYYYLWETYGGLLSEGGYNMRVFRSESPTGPFVDPAGNSGIMDANSNLDSTGLKVMGNYKFSCLKTAYMACGHNSVLRDDDGKWYLFYHARFNDNSEYHEVRVHSMFFNEEGWPVVAPFEYGEEKLSAGGYDENDIAGTYEFIDHGTATDGKIITASTITLGADHTVSGAVNGTWEQDAGSSAAVITIGGQRYSGYFLAAEDEAGKMVMSFTAVGSNNHTVWGAQTKTFSGSERSGTADYTDKNSMITKSFDSCVNAGDTCFIGDTDLLSGVSYYIINKNSGMAIDLPNGEIENGTNIQQWEHNKLWAQQWRINSYYNGYCSIVSVGNEKMCIAVAESSSEDGVNVELQPYDGKDNQLWKLVKNGSEYGIVSKCSKDTAGLDVYDWSKENGGNVNQWNFWGGACQLWSIVPVHPALASGDYIISSSDDKGYLYYNSKGVCLNTTNYAIWHVEMNGDDTCTVDSHSKLMNVEGGSPDDGTGIVLGNSKNGSAEFRVICNKDGSYSLLTSASGEKMALDVTKGQAVQKPFDGSAGQKLVFVPLPSQIIVEPRDDVKGDVNYDGLADFKDLKALQDYIVGRKPGLVLWKNGDLNENGIIDPGDLVLIRRLVCGVNV
jgi:arabinan endo-1,5-alpha-L-arabinosidase